MKDELNVLLSHLCICQPLWSTSLHGVLATSWEGWHRGYVLVRDRRPHILLLSPHNNHTHCSWKPFELDLDLKLIHTLHAIKSLHLNQTFSLTTISTWKVQEKIQQPLICTCAVHMHHHSWYVTRYVMFFITLIIVGSIIIHCVCSCMDIQSILRIST